MKIEHSIEVENPLSDVFGYIRQWRKSSLHSISGKDLYSVAFKRLKNGISDMQYQEAFSFLGRSERFLFQIKQLIPNHEILGTYDGKNVAIEERICVEPAQNGNGTRIYWTLDVELQGITKILSPIVKNNISQQIYQRIKNMQEQLNLDFVNKTSLGFATQNHQSWL